MASSSDQDKRLALLHQHHRRILQAGCEEEYVDKPILESNEYTDRMRKEVLKNLTSSDQICHSILRMRVHGFVHLCELLQCTGLVRDTKNCSIEEKVAKFLYLVTHNIKYQELCFFFHCDYRSISYHMYEVLRAIISLHEQFIKQPDGSDIPPQIYNNNKFYPYFKDCLGAIDGIHIRVRVLSSDAPKYKGRKDWPTTNVLAACSFDMKFTYVLPGWEGTASDSRVLKNAISRSDSLKIPEGKYYLGDAGFGLKSWLMTPYRGVRYHLKEYSKHDPQNERELYNHRHAYARNVIERAFGVLKKRFPIVASETEPLFEIGTHIKIILACCVLHNYLMGVDSDAEIIADVDEELLTNTNNDICHVKREDEDGRKGSFIRDAIANEMWNDYVL